MEKSFPVDELNTKIDSLEKLVKNNKNVYFNKFLSGYYKLHTFKTKEAIKDFNVILKDIPDYELAKIGKLQYMCSRASFTESEINKYTQTLKTNDSLQAIVHHFKAKYYLLKKNKEESHKHIKLALKKLPKFSQNYFLSSEIFDSIDSLKVESYKMLKQAINLNPKNYIYYFVLALKKERDKDIKGYTDAINQILSFANNNIKKNMLHIRARFYEEDKKLDLAEKDYLEVFEIDKKLGSELLFGFYFLNKYPKQTYYEYAKILIEEYGVSKEDFKDFLEDPGFKKMLSN